MERYTKNHCVGLWSIPVDCAKITEDLTILRSVSSFKIKNTIVDNIWDLYVCLCTNGASMEQGVDCKESHSPTGSHSSLRMMIALSAALCMKISDLDVDNTFQYALKEDTKYSPSLYLTMPPLYLAWLRTYFPKVKVQGNGPYVLQCLKQMQGVKDTSRNFYQLIKVIFAKIDLHQTSVDGGFYAFAFRQKYIVFVCSKKMVF